MASLEDPPDYNSVPNIGENDECKGKFKKKFFFLISRFFGFE